VKADESCSQLDGATQEGFAREMAKDQAAGIGDGDAVDHDAASGNGCDRVGNFWTFVS
jgi:hypothetical protein